MKNFVTFVCLSLAFAADAAAQGRPLDWSFYGGDAQRTGWEKSDYRITKDNVKDFQLVLKLKLDEGGPRSLTPPVVIGNLISYRGFKELGFVAAGSGKLWSIDVDTSRIFWQKQLVSSSKPDSCGVTATPALTPPTNFGARPRPAAASTRSPGAPPSPAGAPASRGILGGGGFGAPRPAFALFSDGKLHVLNTSNGDDLVPAIPFVPEKSRASALTISDGAIYTTTSTDCGVGPAGVWALDLSAVDPKDAAAKVPPVASFRVKGGSISSLGGLAIGTDGTVYVQTGDGSSRTLLALSPKVLKVQKQFTSSETGTAPPVTPVVFDYKGRDLIVTAGNNGVLYLLDSQSLGGPDGKTPLSQTPPLTPAGRAAWGGLSSWQDTSGTRWVLAPMWDAANHSHGVIAAYKVEEHEGKPVLTPEWVSHEMDSPEPPVITSGVVFALASGGHATLYALDALTGKEIYSTGTQVSAPGNLTGVTIANGRVFFTTTDGTLYGFGIFLER